MYYQRFHRGLTFTKSGLYALFLILFIGLIAISTGLSGLYLFLSAGLGSFVVSGILSEKAMRAVLIEDIGAVVVDEGSPCPLTFRLRNRHRRFTIFGLDTLFFRQLPRYKLISGHRAADAKHRVTVLAPESSQLVKVLGHPLRRGHIQSLAVMHVTTFPLGLLEKYKIEHRSTSIMVIPPLDQALETTLSQKLHGEWSRLREANEYYGHRPYKRDDIRHIDLRKSAGKAPAKWVVKERKDETPEDALEFVVIRAHWDLLIKATDATQYETILSLIRTSVQAAINVGTRCTLALTPAPVLAHIEDIWRFLAEIPTFGERHSRVPPNPSPGGPGPGREKAGPPERVPDPWPTDSLTTTRPWAVITIHPEGAEVLFPARDGSEGWEA